MPKPINKKRVMVFGTFDRLHHGHLSFLKQAKRHGDELIVAVANDRIVQMLKNKKPLHDSEKRRGDVAQISGVTNAVIGDDTLGTYSIVKKHKPDVICLGYDQNELKNDLKNNIKNGNVPEVRLITLKPHFPQKFKTSILEKLDKNDR
ncbi:MAG: hypothetical protein A2931_02555 [Candidatus Niyogibacteria bacterium RIFCSPLOWO2_01_FULL_45_48]|uniref:Cytidyltransferase-like domain-containing protein n=2 Tax=Candidatus Niyogiibacteriota TaxID=1817912 RepID=A0A1G2F1B8_9BACT|nr:MAG: hypothetical protein A2835_03115 [Candidatus Niyogibacteria bacterium RIFCSPHIGHO2_01_FULL_45_28]OGZ30968.1 MAG: hypothetical protein A2931_02555 [Candidatus Niyogibacteria bacterium RIFCSPLOWO2_01_FULL_45_48]OGZ31378.1 MAG: hypothetical protein A3J00_01995 [Candidatus Niyogibacteria bacterium RIFCSPLOWO2_02_FULL_45_13]